MSLTLSSAEIEQLSSAIQLLVSPLDHATVDDWRSAVNRHLKVLLRADSAGFLLPVSDGLMMFSEEHDPTELASYPDVVAPDMADGTPMWEQMINSRVDTLANMYGREYHRYLESAYYNEYAGANGAHDTLSAAVSLGGVNARTMASLHFWHARPDGRLFGEREIQLLRLLFPAFAAGVHAHLRWGTERHDLLGTLDRLGNAALVCDASGTLLHVTPGLEALLQQDAESALLRTELLSIVHEVCRSARGPCPDGGGLAARPVRSLRTDCARYQCSGCLYRGRTCGRGYVVVNVERFTPARRTPDELREDFSLTRAEGRVALLLGDGKSNAAVAQALHISPHTARRHTERVLHKMGLRSRSEVGARLYR